MDHDRHLHTPYCPHGSVDAMSEYVENAINLGLASISFTEHAPLPKRFIDPVPEKDSAMTADSLALYLDACFQVKKDYSDQIKINVGLEVDYIQGYEKETTSFLNTWGPELDDSILSVHFLKPKSGPYICLDYSQDSFKELVNQCGSVKNVYQLYYDTLCQSITYPFGKFSPDRIGHITLVRKFQKLFPRTFDDSVLIEKTLTSMVSENKKLDVNAAGLYKEHCQEIYPPVSWVKRAKDMNIPLVYGSDAHVAKQLGQGRSTLQTFF
ncbi:histidinol-phosphatase HisJ [Salipaludibacillus sp. HK11]|uniref:histidinol-phosphatase HisJ n=1 Tax=Salipaludibacillus sp. HK11 TaxID=3394320 RepID=UPI0039FCCC75